MLIQGGPPPGPPPGPQAITLFDTIMAGGCLGFLVILCTLAGLLLALVFLIVFKRRGAIIGISILTAPPILLGLLGTGWAFVMINQKIGTTPGGRASVDPAELAEANSFAMITTWMGLIGSGLIMLFLLLAVLVKPKHAAEAPPPARPRRRRLPRPPSDADADADADPAHGDADADGGD